MLLVPVPSKPELVLYQAWSAALFWKAYMSFLKKEGDFHFYPSLLHWI